jgi:FMN phosphatase YigB (HAD superfamily)
MSQRRLRVGFDLDGTLMDSPYGRLWFRPWVRAQEAVQGVEPGAFLAQLRDAGIRRWRQGRWAAAYDWPGICRQTLGLTLPPPDAPRADLVWPLVLPGALALLRWLWDRRAELVLVTNGFDALQWPYLKALGWDRLFRDRATPDAIGTAKPDPRMFDARGPLDLFVGDRPWQDGLGAHRAGIPVALVGPGPRQEDHWDPLGQPRPAQWVGPDLAHLAQDLDGGRVLEAHR